MAYSKAFLFGFLALLLLSFSNTQNRTNANLNYSIIWEDDFSRSEKEKVKTWLNEVSFSAAQCLGVYRFPITYHIYDHGSSGEPVPWANTIRHEKQGVNFHINPQFDLIDFQRDWTAAHEISHLSLPFVGKENMWFSEGYASYMQWHILQRQGLFSKAELNEIYNSKINLVTKAYSNTTPFLTQAEVLKQQHNYPDLYWGGACYFMAIDKALQTKHNTNLFKIIKNYQNNGRLKDNNLQDVIASLDQLSRTSLFSQYYQWFSTKSGQDIVNSLEYLPHN